MKVPIIQIPFKNKRLCLVLELFKLVVRSHLFFQHLDEIDSV